MSDLIIILGDRGGGKTLAAVRRMVIRQHKCNALAYTNFPVKKIKHVILDEHSFIKEVPQEKGKDKLEVNWDYWREVIEKHKKSGQPFDIYIDEAHNVVSSRNSMSKKSQLYSDWIAQLRKILGENAGNSCCIISQTLKKIDVNFRDLADYVIKCNKYKLKNNTAHTLHIWKSHKLRLAIDWFLDGEKPSSVDGFYGKPFYNYYDTYYVVDFGK